METFRLKEIAEQYKPQFLIKVWTKDDFWQAGDYSEGRWFFLENKNTRKKDKVVEGIFHVSPDCSGNYANMIYETNLFRDWKTPEVFPEIINGSRPQEDIYKIFGLNKKYDICPDKILHIIKPHYFWETPKEIAFNNIRKYFGDYYGESAYYRNSKLIYPK